MAGKQRRHVWVRSGGDLVYPGLVLAWRRTRDGAGDGTGDGAGWEAQVAVVRPGSVLTSWLPADDLTPVADDSWQNQPPARPS